MKKITFNIILALVIILSSVSVVSAAPAAGKIIGVNVVLNTDINNSILVQLGKLGKIRDVVYEIDALTMQIDASRLPEIQALPYVVAANPDAARNGRPVATAAAASFANGYNTWDLDAVNVTNLGEGRVEPYTGEGVYVAVLDTGLLKTWRNYFPADRIAVEYGIAFGGGGGEVGFVSSQPNKWELDQDSHGTHVTSTILGYSLRGTPINGVAPDATVIPVKVLNQNGSGWSSVVARGITYVGDLKAGPLKDYPVVINMSLGGPSLDAMEKAAIDYAIDQGVIIVASAGNEGEAGMGYPGAYGPVISVAASGWIGEWSPVGNRAWWNNRDVPDPVVEEDFYITDFSSRALADQDLDIAAPGSWIVGPYQTNGQLSYYFLGGTSMASPHVAGIVALMLQKDGSLLAPMVETYLESAAIHMNPGCRDIYNSAGAMEEVCWDSDATGAGLITADAALDAVP